MNLEWKDLLQSKKSSEFGRSHYPRLAFKNKGFFLRKYMKIESVFRICTILKFSTLFPPFCIINTFLPTNANERIFPSQWNHILLSFMFWGFDNFQGVTRRNSRQRYYSRWNERFCLTLGLKENRRKIFWILCWKSKENSLALLKSFLRCKATEFLLHH